MAISKSLVAAAFISREKVAFGKLPADTNFDFVDAYADFSDVADGRTQITFYLKGAAGGIETLLKTYGPFAPKLEGFRIGQLEAQPGTTYTLYAAVTSGPIPNGPIIAGLVGFNAAVNVASDTNSGSTTLSGSEAVLVDAVGNHTQWDFRVNFNGARYPASSFKFYNVITDGGNTISALIKRVSYTQPPTDEDFRPFAIDQLGADHVRITGVADDVRATGTNSIAASWALIGSDPVLEGTEDPSALSPPSRGFHEEGEIVFNSAPTPLGHPGTGFVVEGWRAAPGGTPGAWTPILSALSPPIDTRDRFGGIQKTGVAAYTQRDGAPLVWHRGLYFLLGGWNGLLPNGWSATEVTTNQVWSSPDLVTWTLLLAHDPNPPTSGPGARWRRRHTFGAFSDGTYLYVVGGDTSDGLPVPSDVWRSLDGIVWERVAATSPGWQYLSILGYFQEAIHVLGGSASPSEHWRSLDGGLTWERLPDLPFARASVTHAVVDDVRQRMYVIGGIDPTTGEDQNDTWEFDGVAWRQASASAVWLPRQWIATAFYANRLWALTGSNVLNQGGLRYSDNGGATWTEVDAYPFPPSHADGIAATPNGIALASGSGLALSTYLIWQLPLDPCVFTATLPWSLWFEGANYNPITPTVFGKVSTGLSAAHSLLVGGSPAQGEIAGRPTIVLDGVNDFLRYVGGSDTLDIFSLAEYTFCLTARIFSSTSNSATVYDNAGLASDSTAYVDFGVRSNGTIEVYHDGGSATFVGPPTPTWVAGDLVHIQIRFVGGLLQFRYGKGTWTSIAKGPIASAVLGPFHIGANRLLNQFVGMEICEGMASLEGIGDASLDRVAVEQNKKWGCPI